MPALGYLQTGQKGRIRNISCKAIPLLAGSDNALFEKRILLKPEKDAEDNGGKLMVIRPEPLRRKDVEENLPDQTNVGLTGFGAVIDGTGLAKGSYRIGVLARILAPGRSFIAGQTGI